jgi:hypothetical protein
VASGADALLTSCVEPLMSESVAAVTVAVAGRGERRVGLLAGANVLRSLELDVDGIDRESVLAPNVAASESSRSSRGRTSPLERASRLRLGPGSMLMSSSLELPASMSSPLQTASY